MQLLREYRPAGVVHCFSGSAETAQEVLALGMYIGFTGVLTFKNAKKALRALAVVPKDRLVLETDCPYMAPVPFRGSRCDSSMILRTAEVAAQVLGTSTEALLQQTLENGRQLYRIF
jgi:TatD DNase family protein